MIKLILFFQYLSQRYIIILNYIIITLFPQTTLPYYSFCINKRDLNSVFQGDLQGNFFEQFSRLKRVLRRSIESFGLYPSLSEPFSSLCPPFSRSASTGFHFTLIGSRLEHCTTVTVLVGITQPPQTTVSETSASSNDDFLYDFIYLLLFHRCVWRELYRTISL